MNIVIFGAGQLGTHCYHKLKKYYGKNANVRLFSRNEIDITDRDDSIAIIQNSDFVINCAAFTNVDAAESTLELNYDNYGVNAFGVKNLARNCKLFDKPFIHISTDFVYGKIKDNDCFTELFETDSCKPCNEYGRAKLDGEKHVLDTLAHSDNKFLILRVAWLYGPYGKSNFIKAIFNALYNDNLKELNVVDDQFGRPTSTELVSNVIIEYINGNLKSGLYNLTNNGILVSKFELADFIKDLCKVDKKINRLSTDDYQKLSLNITADRQKNSNLNISKIREQLGEVVDNWEYDVTDYVQLLIKQRNEWKFIRWIKKFIKRIFNR